MITTVWFLGLLIIAYVLCTPEAISQLWIRIQIVFIRRRIARLEAKKKALQ